MYQRHWKLSGRPFENWCESRFYFPSDVHRTAMLKLRYGVESRRAAMTLCGDSGMGKTMLIEALVAQLPEDLTPVTRVVFPRLTGDQLLGYVADELTGEELSSSETAVASLRRIERFLRENVEAGRHAVLIIDEAHLLTHPDQLETLRLLLNLRAGATESEAALTMILVGDATLLGLVERSHSLDQRISVKAMLGRYTLEQSTQYIAHRLRTVDGDAAEIFTPAALEMLHMRTAGIPRRINRLADLALMVGYAEDLEQIDGPHIEGVHQELVAVAA
ncbi:ExeA family protein [Candidatus Laterigemmans baculatus]|uniref:ExeA family protein n=1 Tax=Candidatus Laterigemmans baculatus TaxID=2770505 RepID=UPI0013D91524|nr:AAA family ATPase [Candidatus Laterigemmans baculatus]